MSQRATGWRACAVLLLSAAAPLAAQEGARLVPRFTAGESVRYWLQLTVETESGLTPPGQASASQSTARASFDMTWRLDVLAAEPDGAAELRATIEALQVETVPPPPTEVSPTDFVNKTIAYRLRPDGRVENVRAPDEWLENGQLPAWLQGWLEQVSGAGSGLPQKPVRPGEHWTEEREIDVPGLPRQRLKAESVYLRDEQVGATPCAAVLTRFELAGSDSSEDKSPESGAPRVDRRVEGGGSRWSCYDLRSGRVLESTQSSQELFRLELKHAPAKPSEAGSSFVLDTRARTESHLRVVD